MARIVSKKQKVLWTNRVTLGGLQFYKPICCNLGENPLWYWDSTGNISCSPTLLGQQLQDGYVYFTSFNKKEVEIWTQGVQAVMHLLRGWAHA